MRASRSSGRRSWLEWPPMLAAALIPVVTALVVWLGPEPRRPETSALLRPEYLKFTLSEPTDRIAFVVWVLAGVAMTGVLVWAVVQRPANPIVVRADAWLAIIALPGITLLALGLATERDATGLIPEVGLTAAAGGIAAALVVLIVAAWGQRWWRQALILASLVVVVLLISRWLQFPSHLADPFGAGYAVNEVLAPGAGRLPLGDYFPQYTHLLGYPIAPLARLFPAQALGIAVGWMEVLQLVTIGLCVVVVAWAWGRRFIWAGVVLVPALALVTGTDGGYALSYFGVNPLRTVLPTAVIAAACWAFSTTHEGASPWRWLFVGLMGGIAALSNPDFGVPVVLAALGLLALAYVWRRALRLGAALLLGALAPFVLYAVALWVAGTPVDWSGWLLYPRVFGLAGYFNVAMDAMGWHVVVVTIFVGTLTTGAVLLRSASGLQRIARRRQGVALFLVGAWSLLSMAYFAGRSLLPTLLGGFAIQIGWCVALGLPLTASGVRNLWRARGRLRVSQVLAVALGALALVASCVGLFLGQTRLPGDRPYRPLDATIAADRGALGALAGDVGAARQAGWVAQMVPLAPVVALQDGIPSALVFNNPDSILMSPQFADRQCDHLARSTARWVVMEATVGRLLSQSRLCSAAWRFDRARPISRDWIVVPRVSSR